MMKQVIDEFKTMPGVIGCCIYSSANGVHISNLPAVFKQERLTAIGEQLLKLHSAGKNCLRDLNNISIYYDEAVIVARHLNSNLLLFIICDPEFNKNTLTISFNLLQKETRTIADDVPVMPTTQQSVQATQIQQDIHSGPLAGLLQEMKAQLGKVLGPVAGLIFDEAVDAWQQQTDPGKVRVEDLIELLNKEISLPRKITQYRELIDPILRKHQFY